MLSRVRVFTIPRQLWLLGMSRFAAMKIAAREETTSGRSLRNATRPKRLLDLTRPRDDGVGEERKEKPDAQEPIHRIRRNTGG
jgi:hypothetical protein